MLRDPTAPIDGAINGNGKESKGNAGLAARLSSANLASKHIIDKRINKMLFNMHGIPVQPNVTNQQQQQNKQKKNKKEQKELDYELDKCFSVVMLLGKVKLSINHITYQNFKSVLRPLIRFI